ncbi:hypothetical protein AVEN_38237-1 [Araneus ventricosus]|uniref:RNase H type-1 domain-containing protein n=1 Tax=Araneus ventricosus TaxID=182803 RepID=A0A4Y2XAJ4_ARAVE|nr:hypothetical protein AVEN_38237-1 [Araneus ventricosus]
MLAHGSAAWCLNPISRMVRKLSSIQRGFLLVISGAYRATPTAALQVIMDILPLYLQLQFESRVTNLCKLRTPLTPEITTLRPEEIDEKETGWASHAAKHPQPNQISLQDGGTSTTYARINTDGSKTVQSVGAAFCVFEGQNIIYRWSAKLRDDNAVFQAELISLKEVVQHASQINNNLPILIHVDNQASLQASINPKSSNKIARIITQTLI